MTEKVVNLNKARKAKARADKETKAAENRVKFGRKISEKERTAALERKRQSHLEGHKLDDTSSRL